MSEVIYKLDRLEDDARDRLEKEGRIIVRCADCARASEEGALMRCAKLDQVFFPRHFCSWGKERQCPST